MLSSIPLSLDLSSIFQFVFYALLLAFGFLYVVKSMSSRYFVVDARFDGASSVSGERSSPESSSSAAGTPSCFVCGGSGSKKCSRCKAVRYCSTSCQSKHWKVHKLQCKEFKDINNLESLPTTTCSRGCGKGRVSLVPARGTCKVLQQPKKVLFPYEEFEKLFNWNTSGFPPCGLLNCGNSCFANVVLQCLASTRPLVAFLLEKGHSGKCNRNDWCFFCELQSHINRVSQSLHPFSPINILSRLPNIGGNLGYGKQEDAHEFMRFAIDTMQSICLDEFGGEKALDTSTQETTLIQHIFGGHLQSQVICTECDVTSYRYENMMDLTVEIQGDVASLEGCLHQFTVKERLDGDNMYKCDGCNDYVRAWKRLTIHQAPNILTIALKRFQSGRFGKLNKRVTFPEALDLGPYMSEGDGSDIYKLYAVVVHIDMLNASFFGHYICYTKDFSGNWYRIDDCKVMKVELEEVLSQNAYMLLYSRVSARRPREKNLEKLKEVEKRSMEAAETVRSSRDIDLPTNLDDASNCLLPGINNQVLDSVDAVLVTSDSRTEQELESQNLDHPPNIDRFGASLLATGSLGVVDLKDLGKDCVSHYAYLEDVQPDGCRSQELPSSVLSLELPVKEADVNCQESRTTYADCQSSQDGGACSGQNRDCNQVGFSLDNSLTSKMAAASDISLSALSVSQNSHSEKEVMLEQVDMAHPVVAGSGLDNTNCSSFAESGTVQNCGINNDSANLETLITNEDLSASFGSGKSRQVVEESMEGLDPVDIACNGFTVDLCPNEGDVKVESHDVGVMPFCGDLGILPLASEETMGFDENDKNFPEVASSCKLAAYCNRFVDRKVVRISEQDGNCKDAISRCSEPTDGYLKSEMTPEQNIMVEACPSEADLNVDHKGTGCGTCDMGLSCHSENDKVEHLKCKAQRLETV